MMKMNAGVPSKSTPKLAAWKAFFCGAMDRGDYSLSVFARGFIPNRSGAHQFLLVRPV